MPFVETADLVFALLMAFCFCLAALLRRNESLCEDGVALLP
jgi:hypothetical protein